MSHDPKPPPSELARLYRESTRAPADRRDCPDPEHLTTLAVGDSLDDPAEQGRIARHVARCADCAEELRLLSEVAETFRSDETRRTVRRGARLGFAVAAGLAVMVIGWALVGPSVDPPVPPPVLRGEAPDSAPAGAARSPRDGERLAIAPRALEWMPLASAEAVDPPSYRVEVYDRGALLWRGEPTASARVELPAELVDSLPRGEPILWRVFVRRGVEEEALGLHTFEIAPADD